METQDNLGSTSVFVGTIGTSPSNFPSSSGPKILEFLLVNTSSLTGALKNILFSMDGGTTYQTLSPGNFFGWHPRGITQISVKGSTSGTAYELIMNLEANPE